MVSWALNKKKNYRDRGSRRCRRRTPARSASAPREQTDSARRSTRPHCTAKSPPWTASDAAQLSSHSDRSILRALRSSPPPTASMRWFRTCTWAAFASRQSGRGRLGQVPDHGEAPPRWGELERSGRRRPPARPLRYAAVSCLDRTRRRRCLSDRCLFLLKKKQYNTITQRPISALTNRAGCLQILQNEISQVFK